MDWRLFLILAGVFGMPARSLLFIATVLSVAAGLRADEPGRAVISGEFRWTSTGPLIAPVERPDDPCVSIKDPTVVHHDGKWHLFCTIRSEKRSHQIEYLQFEDWQQANSAQRHVLPISPLYHCAPQVFYFTPHKKWYLVYQAAHPRGKPNHLPAFSTTTDIGDPSSWTAPAFLFEDKPEHVKSWIDFWVICDASKAHLFFTSNDGRMWRCDTAIQDFPRGWSAPQVVLSGDIFEASHTYRLKGTETYLTVIEAIGERGRRYYQAYTADSLEGEWKPVAGSREKPFASLLNCGGDVGWTTSISHGELIRSGSDEKLEVDPSRLQFLYQGVADQDRQGRPYGKIPWRLGLLTAVE